MLTKSAKSLSFRARGTLTLLTALAETVALAAAVAGALLTITLKGVKTKKASLTKGATVATPVIKAAAKAAIVVITSLAINLA